MTNNSVFKIVQIRKLDGELKRVELLLDLLDADYVPPLSSFLEVEDYAQKIFESAVVFVVESEGADVGLIAIYANDLKTKCAYVSTIGVCREARGNGLGEMLLEKACTHALAMGMNRIRLEVAVDNLEAIRVYRKFGFSSGIEAEGKVSYMSGVMMEKLLAC